jgi:hypothetical protein
MSSDIWTKNYTYLDQVNNSDKEIMSFSYLHYRIEESHFNKFLEITGLFHRIYINEKAVYLNLVDGETYKSGSKVSETKVKKAFWLWINQEIFRSIP